MPLLHYCRSQYEPTIQDLDALFMLTHRKAKILAICARDGQMVRLARQNDPNITIGSWWDYHSFETADQLLSFDVVVILDRDRIHPMFYPLLQAVERLLDAPYQAPPDCKV